jgi:hypothetical protein
MFVGMTESLESEKHSGGLPSKLTGRLQAHPPEAQRLGPGGRVCKQRLGELHPHYRRATCYLSISLLRSTWHR